MKPNCISEYRDIYYMDVNKWKPYDFTLLKKSDWQHDSFKQKSSKSTHWIANNNESFVGTDSE